MPVLDILHPRGGLLPHPHVHVLAVMLYPDDEKGRRHYILMEQMAAHFRTSSRLATINRPSFNLLRSMPSGKAWDKEIARLRDRGEAAGWILTRLLFLHDQLPGKASLNKSIDVEHQAREQEDRTPASRSYLKQAWRTYRPVAHLWASLCTLHENSAHTLSLISVKPLAFLEFLSFAEELRALGESCREARSDAPVLPSGLAWTVPEEVELPTVGVAKSDEPSEALRTALRRYQAPKIPD